MIKPAFIVDGQTEVKILQKVCPGVPVKRSDINGASVSINAIVSRLSSIIKAMGNRHYPIIILIDKEKRPMTIEEMANAILNGLKENGIYEDVRVGVADTMLENWIIADWASFAGRPDGKPVNTDGINGSAIVKREKGYYHKTTNGVNLFLNIDTAAVYKESASFKHFVDLISDLNCPFLKT